MKKNEAMIETNEHEHMEAAGKHEDGKVEKGIFTAFLLNFIFVLIEIAGGIFTNSVAILSDAVHDFGDCMAIAFAWVLEKKSLRKADKIYTYGYRRYSLMSAVVTGLILLVGSAVVITTAIGRIMEPAEVKSPYMMLIAVVGIVVNGAAVLKNAGGKNLNQKSISLHLFEDVLGWAAVLAGSILIYFTKLSIIDPLLSIGVALFVIIEALKNLKEAVDVLLEKAPEEFDYAEFTEHAGEIEGLVGLHHVHVWTLDGEGLLATLHAVVEDSADSEQLSEIKRQLRELSESFGIGHVTIQTDYVSEGCCDVECTASCAVGNSDQHHHHHH